MTNHMVKYDDFVLKNGRLFCNFSGTDYMAGKIPGEQSEKHCCFTET